MKWWREYRERLSKLPKKNWPLMVGQLAAVLGILILATGLKEDGPPWLQALAFVACCSFLIWQKLKR